MRRLVDVVQEADYYLASGLSCAADPLGNCYLDFFSDFQTSSYLTFNYDSLPELFLMKLGRWDPRTGYGVSVRVGLQPTGSVQPVLETGSLVLHLHGTFCLETEEFSRPTMRANEIAWIEPLPEPEFYFEPGPIAFCFSPFRGARVGHSQYAPEWVVAPVPNKAKSIASPFVRIMYQQAQELARSHSVLVVIGYSFNRYDQDSFQPILNAVAEGGHQVLIVSPDSAAVKNTLSGMYTDIVFRSVASTFAEWVRDGYPGLIG